MNYIVLQTAVKTSLKRLCHMQKKQINTLLAEYNIPTLSDSVTRIKDSAWKTADMKAMNAGYLSFTTNALGVCIF